MEHDDAKVQAAMLEFLNMAKAGLTEDSLGALFDLANEIETGQALMELILEGKIEAMYDEKEDEYKYRARKVNEQV